MADRLAAGDEGRLHRARARRDPDRVDAPRHRREQPHHAPPDRDRERHRRDRRAVGRPRDARPRRRRLRRLRPGRAALEGGRGGGGAGVLRRRARRPRGHVAGPQLQARPGGAAHPRLPRGQPAAHVPPRRPARRRRDRHGPRAAGQPHAPARLDHRGHRGGRAQPLGRPRLLHRHAVGARRRAGRDRRRPLVGERAGAPAGEREGAAREPRAVPRGDQARQGGLRLRRAPLDARPAPGHGQRRARAHARDLRHRRGVRGARAGADGHRHRRPDLPAARRRAARAPAGADRADRAGGGGLHGPRTSTARAW